MPGWLAGMCALACLDARSASPCPTCLPHLQRGIVIPLEDSDDEDDFVVQPGGWVGQCNWQWALCMACCPAVGTSLSRLSPCHGPPCSCSHRQAAQEAAHQQGQLRHAVILGFAMIYRRKGRHCRCSGRRRQWPAGSRRSRRGTAAEGSIGGRQLSVKHHPCLVNCLALLRYHI